MDRFIFSYGAVALMGLGLCTVVWPEWIALQNRDEDDRRPLTAGAIWTTRVLGVVLIAGGGYFLYALWTRMPGAEFFPA